MSDEQSHSSRYTPPPGLALYQLAVGHYVSRALALAVTLDIAEHLGAGPHTAETLAAATETHAPALRRVLRLLVSVGVLDEDAGGRFATTALGALLHEDAPGSMKAMVKLFAGVGIQDSWRELEFCVRTGEPAFRLHDPEGDAFTQIERDPEGAANFDKAMATFAPQTAAAVAEAYDFSRFATVMDVGGGNGAILMGILDATPGVRGVVFEQPHVAERARADVAARGFGARVDVVAGSFFDHVPQGADAIVLKHVIHDWNDEQARHILENCRQALPADGKLLILEGLYPETLDDSWASRGAACNDVNMLVNTGGRQRTQTEFRELYQSAGLALTGIVPTASGVLVIEGAPAPA